MSVLRARGEGKLAPKLVPIAVPRDLVYLQRGAEEKRLPRLGEDHVNAHKKGARKM